MKSCLTSVDLSIDGKCNQTYDGASPSDEIIAGAEKALIDVSGL